MISFVIFIEFSSDHGKPFVTKEWLYYLLYRVKEWFINLRVADWMPLASGHGISVVTKLFYY